MAFWGEGNIPGVWQGLMGRKKRYNTPFYEYEAEYSTSPVVASQTPTAPFGGGIGKSAYQGVGSKKKGNKLKYIVEALQELEGPEPPKLSGGKFGRAMPAPLGFSLANMGAYVGDPVARQTAMAKSRMEEELQRRRKLLGGGY